MGTQFTYISLLTDILVILAGGISFTVLTRTFWESLYLIYIDKTSYKVDGRKFSYKGFNVSIKIETNYFRSFGSCSPISSDIYYVNDKPVACMYKFVRVLHTSRVIFFSNEYDTSDFYKVLRVARADFKKELKERCNQKKEKIYD